MSTTYPGMTVETLEYKKGSSKQLFDSIFAAGGLTLSQVCIMTGLEPYLVQNWVKRGFVSSPIHRMYSRNQFARIIIINMLRESLQIEKICDLIRIIGGKLDDPDDDMISDEELYHRYVDMVADVGDNISTKRNIAEAAERASESFVEGLPGSRKNLEKILQIMLYAHISSNLHKSVEELFATLS